MQVASYKNSHTDVKYSIGNTVNNTVISMCGVRWVLGTRVITLKGI